jgi:ABC-type microcin C transport system duplicated ATPase subunit YejF
LIVSNVNLSDNEPLGRIRMALDSAAPAQIIKSQRNLQHGMNLLYLFFSHAIIDLRTLCFRAILMQHGMIFEPGHVAEFYTNLHTDFRRNHVFAAIEIAT